MQKILIVITLLGLLLGIFSSFYSKTEYKAQPTAKIAVNTPVKPVKAPVKRVKHKVVKYTAPSKKIAEIAVKYKVSETTMNKVIACESGYNSQAIGDGGKSFGLVQIHLPSHPNITKEQALNQDFAIDFLGKSLSQGKGKMWTCFRNLNKV